MTHTRNLPNLTQYDTIIERTPTDAELIAHLTSRARLGYRGTGALPEIGNIPMGLHARLTLSDPPRQSRTIELDRDMTIGANPAGDGVDVSLADWQAKLYGVSRRHVLLRPAGNKVFVIDLGSTNGTFVNGIQITRGWARPLTSGCLLTLGRLNLWFHLVDTAA